MHRKSFRFGDVGFCLESEREIVDSEMFFPFATEETQDGYIIHVYEKETTKNIRLDECLEYYAEGNEIFITFPYQADHVISDWQVFRKLPMSKLFFEKKAVILHASFIIYNGKAVLFSGDSRIGKSTQAGLWEQHRQAEVINGDRTLLFFRENQLYAASPYMSGTSKICKNRIAPVAKIVLLGQSLVNHVSELSKIEAFKRILVQCNYDIKSKEEIEMATQMVADIVATNSILKYDCCKDESAVEELEKYI